MPRTQISSLAFAGLLPLVSSCGGSVNVPADAGAPADVGGCVPDRAAWDNGVRATVERQCGACHGAAPAYGAPYPLLDYDFLLRPRQGGRPVDRIVARLMAGTMPPAGTPAPTDDAARSMVAWASCGAQTPTPGTGLRATRPVFRSPAAAPAGMGQWDLRAGGYAVGPTVRDRYQCFTFSFPGTADRFIRRFELIADRREVLHHVVLLRDPQRNAPEQPYECTSMPEGSDYLYAWAPGQDAFQFPDGGLRVTPGQRVVMQIHYNNGQGLEGVSDNSGVRIFHGPTEGTEYGMVAIGPVGFQVQPRTMGSAESGCSFSRESRVLAGMPHMHGIGAEFTQDIVRAGGARESLIALQGWQFESQLFYDFGTTLRVGDRLTTRCLFNNTTAGVVRSGNRTSDEMCFNFAYVTPPPPERYCDQGNSVGAELPYVPGACAPPGASATAPAVMGRAMVGTAPTLAGGTIPAGRWELSGVTWYLNTASVGPATINLNETTITSRGQLWTGAGNLSVDFATRLNLSLSGGIRVPRDIPTSFGGTYSGSTSPLALTATCGTPMSMSPAIDYVATADALTLGVAPISFSGLVITPRYEFRLAR